VIRTSGKFDDNTKVQSKIKSMDNFIIREMCERLFSCLVDWEMFNTLILMKTLSSTDYTDRKTDYWN